MGRKEKFPPERKLMAVQEYLPGRHKAGWSVNAGRLRGTFEWKDNIGCPKS